MVAEGAIVRMFLYGHDLYAVVAVGYDARQHVLPELVVGTNLLRILSHAYMALVDEKRRFLWPEGLLLPHILLCRVPHLCREDLCLLVLHDTSCPCRYALSKAAIPVDMHLVEVAVLKVFLL